MRVVADAFCHHMVRSSSAPWYCTVRVGAMRLTGCVSGLRIRARGVADSGTSACLGSGGDLLPHPELYGTQAERASALVVRKVGLLT